MIARETGLEVRKLQRWNTRARPAASVPVLRPVEVVQEPASSQAACGFSIPVRREIAAHFSSPPLLVQPSMILQT